MRKKPILLSVRAHLVFLVIVRIAIVLSFKCMTALFDPICRRGEPIKWGLVSYTVIIFSLVTVATGMQLNFQSISYIDNHAFPSRARFLLDRLGTNCAFTRRCLVFFRMSCFSRPIDWVMAFWSTLCLMLRSPVHVSNAGSSSSSIAATLCTS